MEGWSGSKLRQWWRVAFALGCIFINYPFLYIFDRPSFLFGFPLVYLYFFFGWAGSIAVIAFYVSALNKQIPKDGQGD